MEGEGRRATGILGHDGVGSAGAWRQVDRRHAHELFYRLVVEPSNGRLGGGRGARLCPSNITPWLLPQGGYSCQLERSERRRAVPSESSNATSRQFSCANYIVIGQK